MVIIVIALSIVLPPDVTIAVGTWTAVLITGAMYLRGDGNPQEVLPLK